MNIDTTDTANDPIQAQPRARRLRGGRRVALATLALLTAVPASLAAGVSTTQAHTGAEHRGYPGRREHDDPATRLTSAERKAIRAATKRLRKPEAAIAAGYVPTDACVTLPGVGGMGYHFVNPGYLTDGVIDPAKPEILVFHDDGGELRLGAVEYFAADADQDLATDADRPALFARLPFDGPMPGHEPEMPVHYDLHVWLYTDNPAGQLAAWNPDVTCP
jgi:hypothetical protein